MKSKSKLGIILSSSFTVVCVGLIVTGNLLANRYSALLRHVFGTSGGQMTKVNYDGVDLQYYKSDYTKKELIEKEKELTDQIVEEGIVVLEKGNIPYSNSTKLSLFSKSSVDFVFGGTGSGSAQSKISLKDSLENSGFSVNEKLWNFYKNGKGSSYKRGIGSIHYGERDDFSINEVPLHLIKQTVGLEDSFSSFDTGVFVLSRTGGEGSDLARGMSPYVDTALDKNSGLHPEPNKDKYRSYLEPDSIELEIMQYINDNFKDFILIVNCNNAMELGFTKNFNKLKTIIQVPATGENGLNALGKILNGGVASSGRLADTFVYNSFNIPSSQNIGDFEYLVDGKRMKNIKGYSKFDGLFYMNYDESIYIGYRYFETRYEDLLKNQGNASFDSWKYEDNVLYPFGYGDSISKFEYLNMSLEFDGTNFIASIDIKNVGEISAKSPVELYVSMPFGDYEKSNKVERSAIELLSFDKTKELAPNETTTISISFTKEDLKTYLKEGSGQYYLAGGDYYFTFANDAHAAINNVLRKQGVSGNYIPSPSEEIAGNSSLVKNISLEQDLEIFKYDSSTGTEITNQFDFVNACTYDSAHTYLSRQDWKNTYPVIGGELSNITSIHSERTTTSPSGSVGSFEFVKELSKESKIYHDVVNAETYTPDMEIDEKITWNQYSNLDFVDLRGLDINDPRYDEIVDKMSLNDAINLFANGGYQTASIPKINKPVTFDTDGPAGFNTINGHNAIAFNFPCSVIIAQTWNKELMHSLGEIFGEESILYEIQGWYAPTANIHRSPFGGRNFEYFSEDPVLTGEAAKQEINGAAQHGLLSYLKHFALNDQETHRDKETGVCIFAEEQSIRELYLKAFERAIKNNTVNERYYELVRDSENNIVYENGQPKFIEKNKEMPACTAIMSSFSRLGGCWDGACYPLLNNILQEEWGFHGMILTDYYHFWFMDKNQSLLGGGSCILDPQDDKMTISSSDFLSQYMLKKATKNTLFATVNSNTVNGYIHGVKEIQKWANYKTILIIINVTMGTTCLILPLNVLRIIIRNRKKYEK